MYNINPYLALAETELERAREQARLTNFLPRWMEQLDRKQKRSHAVPPHLVHVGA